MSDEDKIVNVPVNVPGLAAGTFSSPRFQRCLQEVIQQTLLQEAHRDLAGMTDAKPDDRRRVIMCWETVAVTALPPGWRNVFTTPGGKFFKPCPAILLQECRSETETWDEPNRKAGGAPFARRSSETIREPPFETRTVFADFDGRWLGPADDGNDYICTIGPGEE